MTIQCDNHRRTAEREACRVAERARKQGALNRAEWLRRASEHEAEGQRGIGGNIRRHVADIDARPGHTH